MLFRRMIGTKVTISVELDNSSLVYLDMKLSSSFPINFGTQRFEFQSVSSVFLITFQLFVFS